MNLKTWITVLSLSLDSYPDIQRPPGLHPFLQHNIRAQHPMQHRVTMAAGSLLAAGTALGSDDVAVAAQTATAVHASWDFSCLLCPQGYFWVGGRLQCDVSV